MNPVTIEDTQVKDTQVKWNKLQAPVVAAEAAVIAAKVLLKATKDKVVVNATEVEEAQKAVYEDEMRYTRIWRHRQQAWITYTSQLSKDKLREAESCGGRLSPTQDPSNGTDGVPLEPEGFTLEPEAVNFNINLNTAVNDLVAARTLRSRTRRNE